VDKPFVRLHGEVKTPPFSAEARLEAGSLFRQLQPWGGFGVAALEADVVNWATLSRVADSRRHVTWRIVYRLDADAVIIAEVFSKKTQATPKAVLDVCKRRLAAYDRAGREETA
jgi:hypothetical protein